MQMVVIDSINGYLQSMPEERLLPIQVHELLSYLAARGVTSILTLVQRGIFGSPVDEAADVSYLADNVVLLRYFEVSGTVRQAVSVVKKRSGNHERTIRECRVGAGGLHVGRAVARVPGGAHRRAAIRRRVGPAHARGRASRDRPRGRRRAAWRRRPS